MPKKRQSCKNDPDTFWYICGKLTLLKYRRNLTDKIKRLYYAYFECVVGDQDKVWCAYGIRYAYDLARAERLHH